MVRLDSTLGLSEAADACGVSDETVRRRIRAGSLPAAFREPVGSGAWRIPIGDLVAAGLRPVVTSNLEDPARPDAEMTRIRDELRAVRVELDHTVALLEARTEQVSILAAHVADLQQQVADHRHAPAIGVNR